MLRVTFVLFITMSTAAFGGTYNSSPVETTGHHIADKDTQGEVQAFDVYDEITESIFESYRLYHPHECRDFFVRKHRSDGKIYVDRLRRCD